MLKAASPSTSPSEKSSKAGTSPSSSSGRAYREVLTIEARPNEEPVEQLSGDASPMNAGVRS